MPSLSPPSAPALALAAALVLGGPPSAGVAQDLRPFTVDDALRVRSVSVAAHSPDARWLAVTASSARGRMGTDHFRFGDPTYVAPRLATLQVVDAESGEAVDVFDEEVHVDGLTWSRDGSRLAFLRIPGAAEMAARTIAEARGSAWAGARLPEGDVETVPVLEVWDRARRRVRSVRIQGDAEPAWGEVHGWLPDGSGVLVGLRPEGWRTEARAAYEALEYGPIVVQDASDDFLSWDAVRMMGGVSRLAVVEVPSGRVRYLTEPGGHADVHVDRGGRHVTWTRVDRLRTSYSRSEGTEYTVLRLDLGGASGGAGGAPGQAGGSGAGVPEPITLVETSERRLRPVVSPDGDHLVWSDRGDLWLRSVAADSAVRLAEGLKAPLTEADSTERALSVEVWSPTGDAVLASAQDGLWRIPLDGADAELVLAYPGDAPEEWREAPRVEVVAWADDGYVYLARSNRERWERGLARLDAAGAASSGGRAGLRVLVEDDDLFRSWVVAEDGSRLVFRRSDGDRPDEIWTAAGDFSGARPLTDSNPWLDGVALAESELITYLGVDGEELHGILYHPPEGARQAPGGGRLPLVAEIYEDFFDNGYNYSAQILAAQGWYVLRPSVDFEIGFPGEAWMKGVTTAINSLMERGLVDGDRLGVHGTSYGGYATNLLITQTDRFKAAINISGKVNIISFLGDSEKITTRNYNAAEETQDRIGATLWEQPQKYVEHSAVMYADRIDTPLLLLTGRGDWNVPDTNTREMYYALRRLGKEVVWVNYMRAGHGAGRAGVEEDFRDHWRRMIDWYDTHFHPGEGEGALSEDGAGDRGGQGARSRSAGR